MKSKTWLLPLFLGGTMSAIYFLPKVGAVAYLVWKLGFASRPRRVKRGPDVPVSRLVRRRPPR